MTDDLRRQLAAEAGTGEPPPLGDVWRTGRRRRSVRRAGTAAGAVAALLLVGGVVTSITAGDGTQTVQTGAVAEPCEPHRTISNEGLLSAGPELVRPPQPPKTAAAMVRGGGSEDLAVPDAVARVKVLRTESIPSPNERLRVPEPPPEHRAWVEVTDPVFGAEEGDRFTISDAGNVRELAELDVTKGILMQQIEDYQREVDQIDAPLAALDAQIIQLEPSDPRYGELISQRGRLKERTDAQRNEAQTVLNDYQQRLQRILIAERLGLDPAGTSCYRMHTGDELVVALVRPGGDGPYQLTGSSSFFLVDGDGFSPELDAARLAVPGWSDSALLRAARESSADDFVDQLRQEAEGN